MRENIKRAGNPGSVFYGMGFIGAVIYFVGHAISFWAGVLGFFKSIFWPAVVVYKVLELLKL